MFGLKTSFRYAFSRTRGQRTTSIMIMVGIAVGLIALLVISAVMNGLQTAQMDQLRNLESFDLIVDSDTLVAEQLESLDGVDRAFRFLETNVLIVDKTSETSSSARIRAYDADVYTGGRMAESLFMLSSNVPTGSDGLFISYSMAMSLGIRSYDDLKVTFLKPGKTATIVPYTSEMEISGYFSSRMTEFSTSTAFMDYSLLSSVIGDDGARIGMPRSSHGSSTTMPCIWHSCLKRR